MIFPAVVFKLILVTFSSVIGLAGVSFVRTLKAIARSNRAGRDMNDARRPRTGGIFAR